MAPDLNALSGGERWDYSTPGSNGYNVPNIVYNDPQSRKLKVLTIGAGLSGIQIAYQIQKYAENVEHVIYEKNADLGGTWLENRYPGCACDIPSHAYTLNFALNPDWPRFFSYAPDIRKYLEKVCDVFELRKYMTFNTEATRAEWQDDNGKWKVTLRQKSPSGEEREFEEESWPQDYQSEQWKNDRVAIIGSGASSIQTVPTMQPHAKHMDVFVRTGVWFVQIADNHGQNKEYSQAERNEFRNDPRKLVAHAKDIERQINGIWGTFYTDSEAQSLAQSVSQQRMKEHIKDERLLKGFTPKFEVGCRRVTPGDPYMKAIQEPNVDVHFTAVNEITENGLIGADGLERHVDTIICATGFDVTYRPRFPIIGKNGVNLSEKWARTPESYLGLACPDMPNFLIFIGPTWPVENGSMQRDHIKSWVPRQDVTDAFNAHAQEWIKHTVWKGDCRSWYKDNDTGRVNAVWPGSSNHYSEVVETPRYEDFEIEYQHSNLWGHLGMGYAICNKKFPESDVSPYLQLENIDPKWLKAIGYQGPLCEAEKL
ncbi:FAD/NAD(P)-binding domain-containing protein [Stemphylium lycopersici]|nr:FAD/NAD(P)-binding domain-containing protein [Stemphylium lycopersici]